MHYELMKVIFFLEVWYIMAQKRMFSRIFTESDDFIDMPAMAQLLYIHLSMNADDDGFVNNPKTIMRICGAGREEIDLLRKNEFIISFDSGVIVIRHWKLNNNIRKDTYHETVCLKEKASLGLDENNIYYLLETENAPIQSRDEPVTDPSLFCNVTDTQVSVDKVSIDKCSIDKCSVDKNSVDKISTDKNSEDKCSVDRGEDAVEIQCRDGNYIIEQELYQKYTHTYPKMDIKKSLLKLQSYLGSNPQKQKYKNNMKSYINMWLMKDNDEKKYRRNKTHTPTFDIEEYESYSVIDDM